MSASGAVLLIANRIEDLESPTPTHSMHRRFGDCQHRVPPLQRLRVWQVVFLPLLVLKFAPSLLSFAVFICYVQSTRAFVAPRSSPRTNSSMSRGGRSRGGGRGGRGGGRGEYYKNKYGGGGKGRGSSGDESGGRVATGGGTHDDLQRCLQRIDGKSYGAYHDLDTPPTKGWTNSDFGYTLFVERAQSDPFAAPTRCRVVLPAAQAGFPPSLWSNPIRKVALADYVLRSFFRQCREMGADAAMGGKEWSGPKGGDIQILAPCQHVLEQSAIRFDALGNLYAQLTINLPARGRTILGQAAEKILGYTLPTMVQRGLCYSALDRRRLKLHVECVEDQCWLRDQLDSKHLVAFIANGAILPRMSGVDDQPMDRSNAVAFQAPKRLEVSFTLPNAGGTGKKVITGMGIPKGISLICGGGFHGKSTLLEALQVGVYPKIPGDGREFCVTSLNACKIRAEDGRNVQSVDISNFINNLPFGKDTTCFSTMDASGSTSQATNIVESIEAGADTLLIDEDTCATNFMIRDNKMMQLVAADKEPITPFVRIVRSLYDDKGISTILVVGGVGDYFDVADNVLVMDCYKCNDVTERAKQIVANSLRASELPHTFSENVPFQPISPRSLRGNAFSANGKVKVSSQSTVLYAETELDISGLEQLVTRSQTVAISNAIQQLPSLCKQTKTTSIVEVLQLIEERIDAAGLTDVLSPGQLQGGMSRPRRFEIAGAINRLRRQKSIEQST